jgi:hypothetical protein
MLKNIIKKYLFESRRFKAVVKKADSKSFNSALDAGAVYAFDVVYTIKWGRDPLPTEKDVMDTLDDIISADGMVGASSKYAVAENKYVLSNNLKDSERRMKWNVWIVPAVKRVKTSTAVEEPVTTGEQLPEIPVTATRYSIGKSTLVQFKRLNATEQIKYKEINNGAPVTPTDNNVITTTSSATPKSDTSISAEETPAIETGVPIQNLFKQPEPVANLDSPNNPSKITYPVTAQDGNMIYTMSDTDPYVYTLMDNKWRTIRKADYEAGKSSAGTIISNRNAINKLNTQFNKNADLTVKPIAPIGSKVRFNKTGVRYYLYWFTGKKIVNALDAKKGEQWYQANNENERIVTYLGPSTTDPNYSKIGIPAGGKTLTYFVKTNDIESIK